MSSILLSTIRPASVLKLCQAPPLFAHEGYVRSFAAFQDPKSHHKIITSNLATQGLKTHQKSAYDHVAIKISPVCMTAFKISAVNMTTTSTSSKASLDPSKIIEKVAKSSDIPPHFTYNLEKSGTTPEKKEEDYALPHPIWSREESESVEIVHRKPEGFVDHMAYYSVTFLRKCFDLASGYTIGKRFQSLDERSVLIRCIFLETVAGVPGFSAAMIRHLHSLRRMQRDHGWIHTLLEEAENERMHLMTFLQLKKPGPFFRGVVVVSQWAFIIMFSSAYLVSPNFCHRFVGYLEEQAVVTYTHILEELDNGNLPMWKHLPAPPLAVEYWRLPQNAMMRDVILAIRADEAHHRLVNHTLGSMDSKDKNPFKPGQ